MALTGTRMLAMIENSPAFDKNMNRLSRYGAADAHIVGNSEMESIVSPNLREQAMRSVGRDLKIPVLDAKTVTLGSTRSVTIADDDNDSALYTVSWTTYTGGFTLVPTHEQNNYITLQRDFEKKFKAMEQAFCEALETSALTNLDGGKTQIIGDLLDTNKYALTANILESNYASRESLIGDLSSIQRTNDYQSDTYRVIGNGGVDSLTNKLLEHAVYNDQNKQLQVRDKSFHFTNRLANGVGHIATGYCVPPGNLGYLIQHEREALVNRTTKDGHEWGITTLPALGIPLDYYSYEGVSDESTRLSETDMTRVYKEHHGFALTLAWIRSYNTDLAANASPILKFAVTAV